VEFVYNTEYVVARLFKVGVVTFNGTHVGADKVRAIEGAAANARIKNLSSWAEFDAALVNAVSFMAKNVAQACYIVGVGVTAGSIAEDWDRSHCGWNPS